MSGREFEFLKLICFLSFFVLVKHSIQQQLPTGDEYDDEQEEQPAYTAPARRNALEILK